MTTNSNPEVLSRAKEQLAKSSPQYVEGIPFFSIADANWVNMVDFIQKTELRHDDVINIAHPRSGNHWFMEIVQMVLKNEATYAKEPLIERLMESQVVKQEDKVKKLATMEEPRLLSTHMRPSRGPQEIAEKGVRIIYVVRNPKDVMCSWFKLLSSVKSQGCHFHGSWEEFFELSLIGETPWGSWFDHVLDLEQFMKDHPSVPVFVGVYEKFRDDPVPEIRKLAKFLGQPEDKVAEIAEATGFKAMKQGVKGKMEEWENKLLNKSSNGAVISKGVTGGWKNQFTVDMNERFDREFDERMKGSWVANMVRDYM